jgi:hypothetical protein
MATSNRPSINHKTCGYERCLAMSRPRLIIYQRWRKYAWSLGDKRHLKPGDKAVTNHQWEIFVDSDCIIHETPKDFKSIFIQNKAGKANGCSYEFSTNQSGCIHCFQPIAARDLSSLTNHRAPDQIGYVYSKADNSKFKTWLPIVFLLFTGLATYFSSAQREIVYIHLYLQF